jgi:exodeoxyribonuclease VII large subunit
MQRLDEFNERLRRGLFDRAALGREKLGRLRLSAVFLQRNWREASERLAALARLAEQLHPERPLSRGYAMVLDAADNAVTSAAAASKEALLGIKFADGTIEAVPGVRPRKPAKRDEPKPESGQPKLL